MHFTSAAVVAVAAAALALCRTVSGAPALAPARPPAARNDPHELDFRTFGVAGCFEQNQGVYTLELSDASQCRRFVDAIGSLNVSDNLCTFAVYDDDACAGTPLVVPTGVCQNGQWLSYKLTC